MPKFLRRRELVDAVQFKQDDIEYGRLPKGVVQGKEALYGGGDQRFFREKYGPIYAYYVDTPNGQIVIRPGDWVVTLEDGSRYPYEGHVFEKLYEKLDSV